MPPAILLLEYKSKAEMAHIPQSQDDHQMTMEDSEHNFQNMADDIPMVGFTPPSLSSTMKPIKVLKKLGVTHKK